MKRRSLALFVTVSVFSLILGGCMSDNSSKSSSDSESLSSSSESSQKNITLSDFTYSPSNQDLPFTIHTDDYGTIDASVTTVWSTDRETICKMISFYTSPDGVEAQLGGAEKAEWTRCTVTIKADEKVHYLVVGGTMVMTIFPDVNMKATTLSPINNTGGDVLISEPNPYFFFTTCSDIMNGNTCVINAYFCGAKENIYIFGITERKMEGSYPTGAKKFTPSDFYESNYLCWKSK